MTIRYAEEKDRDAWFALDRHMAPDLFSEKVRGRQAYVFVEGGEVIGILRFSLFWDNTPFLNLLYVGEACRSRGVGKSLVEFWERDMEAQGYQLLLTSTQVNEDAQHFYRKLGYRDCGGFVLKGEPMELILQKTLGTKEGLS